MSIKIADKHIDKTLDDLYNNSPNSRCLEKSPCPDSDTMEWRDEEGRLCHLDSDDISQWRNRDLEDAIKNAGRLRKTRKEVNITRYQFVIIKILAISALLALLLWMVLLLFARRLLSLDTLLPYCILATMRNVMVCIAEVSLFFAIGSISSIDRQRRSEKKDAEAQLVSLMGNLREYDKALNIQGGETLETIKKAIR